MYKILAVVEEFTAQILTYTEQHASHVKSYHFLLISQPSPKQTSSMLLHISFAIFLLM